MSEWRADLSWSARAFESLVWPELEAVLGGEMLHVEKIAEGQFARTLDIEAGIDAWHIRPGLGVRGIASRIQAGPRAWGTFTVRRSRDSGAQTEYSKRRAQIASDKGWLWPYLTVQAYITAREGGELLAFAVARTEALIERCAHDDSWVNSTTNASFYCVPWGDWCELVHYETEDATV